MESTLVSHHPPYVVVCACLPEEILGRLNKVEATCEIRMGIFPLGPVPVEDSQAVLNSGPQKTGMFGDSSEDGSMCYFLVAPDRRDLEQRLAVDDHSADCLYVPGDLPCQA